jgi:hypothetical protein
MAYKVKKAFLPENSIIRNALQEIHYKDCFEIAFKSKNRITVDDIFIAFFQSAPKWLEKLMAFRNRLVGLFGLKAPAPDKKELENFKVEVGNGIGLFKIIDKSDKEILVGEDDKHLNFRVSFFLEQDNLSSNYSYSFIFSTTVFFSHWSGKVYFFFVKPFHRIIVPVMAKSIVRNVVKGSRDV